MNRSMYIERLHHIEHDIYVVLKGTLSFLYTCVRPICSGLCLIMAGFGALVIMGWFVAVVLFPVLLVGSIILKFLGF